MSPSPDAIQLADSPRKRKKKFDHTEVIEVSVGSDKTLLSSNECSNKCTYYFWQMNDEEGVNWKKVTKKSKNFYWGEFKKYITHPGFSEEEVYKAWNKKAASRYADWISAMSKLSTKPLKGIEQKTWDSWTNYWKSEKFQKKGNIGKKNRNHNGKRMVNHTSGSQIFEVHLKRLDEKYISRPGRVSSTYTPRKTNLGSFGRSCESSEYYSLKKREALFKLQSEAEASGSSVPNDLVPEKKAALFKEAAGRKKKMGYTVRDRKCRSSTLQRKKVFRHRWLVRQVPVNLPRSNKKS